MVRCLVHSLLFVALAWLAAPSQAAVLETANTDLGLWLKGDAGILDSAGRAPGDAGFSGDVTTWLDQSSFGRDVTQTTSIERPTYVASEASLNNQSLVRFDGVDDSLETSASVTWGTAFVVFKTDYTTTFPDFKGIVDISTGSGGSFAPLQGASGAAALEYSGSQFHPTNDPSTGRVDMLLTGAGAAPTGGNGVEQVALNPLNAYYLISQRLTEGTLLTHVTNVVQLGDVYFRSGRNLDGEIAEVAIFETTLSDADFAEVRLSLEAKYGLGEAQAEVPEPGSLAAIALTVAVAASRSRRGRRA